MLKRLKDKWWLYSDIFAVLLLRSFVEPFRSSFLWMLAAASLIGIVTAGLMAVIGETRN
jgi:hypothetical protein